MALYNSTNGDGWTDHTNWLVTNTPSDWYGVTVTAGEVTGLNLEQNSLNGSLPLELGDLAGLQYLNLNNNQLSGAIPPQLGNLYQFD